jgi:hypothetical protein
MGNKSRFFRITIFYIAYRSSSIFETIFYINMIHMLNMLTTNLVALFSCRLSLSQFGMEDSLPCASNSNCESFQRLVIRVEEPRAEVGSSAAVDNGTAYNVQTFFKCDAF